VKDRTLSTYANTGEMNALNAEKHKVETKTSILTAELKVDATLKAAQIEAEGRNNAAKILSDGINRAVDNAVARSKEAGTGCSIM
jgi:hypothetical protein